MNDQPEHQADDGAKPPLKPPAELIQTLEPFVRPEKANEAAHFVQSLLIAQSHSGPLPPARELAGYEKALTGGADRVVSMAEREQAHRHDIERIIVKTEGSLKKRGQNFAMTSLVASLVIVAFVAHDGHAKEAAWLGAAIIVGVVGLFLGNKYLPGSADQNAQPEQRAQNESRDKTPN